MLDVMIEGSNIGRPLCVCLRVYNILSFRLCTKKILLMHIIIKSFKGDKYKYICKCFLTLMSSLSWTGSSFFYPNFFIKINK
jgi:hypothetical protein